MRQALEPRGQVHFFRSEPDPAVHAEAYPAGELKHGPLALVDAEMPVVVIAPNDTLLEKVK
jgi:hypothetical protein